MDFLCTGTIYVPHGHKGLKPSALRHIYICDIGGSCYTPMAHKYVTLVHGKSIIIHISWICCLKNARHPAPKGIMRTATAFAASTVGHMKFVRLGDLKANSLFLVPQQLILSHLLLFNGKRLKPCHHRPSIMYEI